MIKLFAFVAFIATANAYLNHGPALVAPAPAPYYGHYIGNPVNAVPQQANFLKNYVAPSAVSGYVKSLAPSYETVEKPQAQVTKQVYSTYNPTVTNLPANHESFSVGAPAAGHYAAAANPLPVHGSVFSPAALSSHRYVQLGYPHAPGLPRMPYAPNHIAHVNYPW